MNKEKLNTKEQIIASARELFSEYGYNGTSIRQIADKSGVNIAAINYHFGNKHGLFWSILVAADDWLNQKIADCTEECETLEQLTVSIFRCMLEDRHFVRSTMKAFLTEGVPEPDPNHPYHQSFNEDRLGPSGGDHIVNFIHRQFGSETTSDAIEWAVQSIFSSLFHWATMCSTSTFESMKKKKNMSDEKIEESLAHLARAVASYMTDKNVWKN